MLDRHRFARSRAPMPSRRAERRRPLVQSMAGNEKSREWCIENGVGLTKATSELRQRHRRLLGPVGL